MSSRIVVLGCAGSGKTRFSRQLGVRTDAPAICLDAIWESCDGDLSRFRTAMEGLHSGGAWIGDGNFADVTFDIRLSRATQIVWLERPRLLCALRVLRRVFQPGEAHKMRDLGNVLAFIWFFNRMNIPKIERQRLLHGPQIPVITLRTGRAVDAFLMSAAGDSPVAALDWSLDRYCPTRQDSDAQGP